ncbi:hypothetical protein [Mycobacteroides chelonae]|uniref:Transcription initiation factor TFIID, subunit TAF12 (Also component of histone acetyltransferase SAGA) n=1 Tax=Mycobacteroides chelonae TaxID=1774 RepID=A0A1S1M8B1_MYCCH|nr:hypothetical protein [Mycobacteroides chelonae]OHU78145.1 hypothetical protein BKG84_06795 [Mycobacteroides chelonae]QQG86670.1 hypothetical protein HBA99_05070 [Mycobacteroides chelonae]QQG91487.1 hypothetical protein HBA97_05070 [Mycobacteroides chelonae]
MNDDAPTQTLPAAPSPQPTLPLTGFAAGIAGAALVVVGVWGFHVLTPGGGAVGSVGWVVLLCLAFTALGKGITLLRRALAPVTDAALAPLAPISAPVRATAGIVIGASGIWWVMRGHAATWWTHTTGTGSTTGWTLTSQLVAVALIAVFGALLFGGAKNLVATIFANSGTRHRDSRDTAEQRWALVWSSHPGLGLLLLAGAVALVFLSGYVVPRVSGWLSGDDPMAALAAIAAILIVAFFANTWWWKALSGWWTWAHTHGSSGGGASPLGQMQAGAAVIALIWFSAMGFGLASPQDYTGPGAAPLARAACPPDCGGGGGLDGPPGGGSQFRPPDMPAQQPDYQGGINQAPLNQNSGISIYNESPAQGGGQQASQNMGPQMSGQHAAHGEPLPNYGPWQPDAQPPAQAPVQQAPQAPQPVQQAPAQQPVQQAPQAPQNPVGQQPAQQPQPGQTQPGQQQPQNPANQQNPAQQQPQKQPDQTPQKQPDTPKKNPIDPTDLATAATRRGSQQAGQQAAQQAGQQGTQQATQQTTQQATQQAAKAAEQGTQKAAQPGDQFPADFHLGQVADGLKARGTYSPTGTHWGDTGKTIGAITKSQAENFVKAGERFTAVGRVLEVGKMGVDLANGAPIPETVGATAGSLAGAWAGAEAGALVGAAIGSFLPGPGTAVGGVVGGVVGGFVGSGIGSEVGKALGGAARSAGSALSTAGGAVASFFGSL